MLFTIAARLLGAAGLLSIALFTTLYLFAAETPGLNWIALGAAIGLSSWVYLDWPLVSRLFGSRGGRSEASAWLLILMVAVIGALLLHLAEREPQRWDHSENQMHSLSEQGASIVKQLPDDLEFSLQAYFVTLGDRIQESQRQRFKSLTEATRALRPEFKVEFIDPETQPARASRDQISRNATVIITASSGDSGEPPRSERLSEPDESALVAALLRLSNAERSAVYVVSGHGELSLTETGPRSLAVLAGRLTELGFAVQELDTLRGGDIPKDARVVILAGPMIPLNEGEAGMLRRFVEAGGALLICAEPKLPGEGPERTGLTGLESILADWGMEALDNLILDEVMRRALGDATFPISERFALHEITRNLQLPLVLGTARSLRVLKQQGQQATQVEVLASTSEAAWGETDFNSEIYAVDETDDRGPVDLALLAVLPQNEAGLAGQVLLVGDRDWLSDGLITEFGNLDFAIRAVGHLARRDEVVGIAPRAKSQGHLTMSFLQELLAILTAVLLIPGALLLCSGMLWAWRRNL